VIIDHQEHTANTSQSNPLMLGGEITAKSELGRGSTFTVTISVGDLTGIETVEPERFSRVHAVTPNEAKVELNCRILLVDDWRDVRFLSCGCNDYHSKPIDVHQPLQMVKQFT